MNFCILFLITLSLSSISGINGGINSVPVPTECSKILEEYAQSASNLTMCSILYAKPIKLCEKCIDSFVQFYDNFNKLSSLVINGTSCKSLFISHDRLDAVLEYHQSILAIWNKGHCNACFDWTDGKPELSNNTKNFNKMSNDTLECILINLNPVKNNSDIVCEKCMHSYVLLDNFYKTLSKDSIGVDSVCMDIVDSMNTTRFIWSKELNCCKLRRSPEIIFLCCSGIISLLPLFYYLAIRYCGPIRDLPNVLKQSRFKQRILRSHNGRTD